MPQISLPKGANAVIASPLHTAVRLELRWTAPSATEKLDLFMLLLDSNGRITDNADIVFYNQPDYASGAARYLGRDDAMEGYPCGQLHPTRHIPVLLNVLGTYKLA